MSAMLPIESSPLSSQDYISPVEETCSCSNKCHLVAVVTFVLLGTALATYGIVFSSTVALWSGCAISICSLSFPVFFRCLKTSDPELKNSSSEHAKDIKNTLVESPDFWNKMDSTREVHAIVPLLSVDQIQTRLPIDKLTPEKQVLIFDALKLHDKPTECRTAFAKKCLTTGLLEIMDEREIGAAYTNTLTLHFCSTDTDYSLETRYKVAWQDLKHYHEKILRGILTAPNPSSLVSHFLIQPSDIYISGENPPNLKLYLFLTKNKFDFKYFFTQDLFEKCRYIYIYFLDDALLKENEEETVGLLKTMLANQKTFSHLMQFLLNSSVMRNHYKDHVVKLIDVVSTDTLCLLSLNLIDEEGRKILCEAIKKAKDPQKCLKY